jgi:two-component system, chemotaxis family, protein-glutamate methylesterase/glutaminase
MLEILSGMAACEAFVIGASAGAVDALNLLLPMLPKEARAPIVVVVHLPPNRPSLLAELFAPRCQVRVREPEDKHPVAAGAVWFAPSNYHLLIERDRTFSMSIDEPIRFSRPSIDVLFETAAEAFGSALCALVLTGANDDGARGARAIRDAGGIVVVQDPRTAEAKEMPSAAIALANPQLVASLPEIAELLRQATEILP